MGEDDVSTALEAANRFLAVEDFASAITELTRAAARRPDCAQVWIGLTDAQLRAGLPYEALAAATFASTALKDNVALRLRQSEIFLALQQPQNAFEGLRQVLQSSPTDARPHLLLAVALKRIGRMQEALSSCKYGVMLHRRRPSHLCPYFSKEIAELRSVLEGREPLVHLDATSDDGLERSGELPGCTVLVGCYGDFPSYSIRALDSVAAGVDFHSHCDFLVGLNECCRRTSLRARQLLDDGDIDGIVESKRNLNKDPMLRLLLDMVRTPYILWLDDDTHFIDSSWPALLTQFIKDEHPFDVSGQPAKWGPRRDLDEPYMTFARQRPWWTGLEYQPQELRDWLPFVLGGFFLARTEFLRSFDFPDRGMTKALDDVLLSELVHQVAGRIVPMPKRILECVTIGEGDRRGEDFLLVPQGSY